MDILQIHNKVPYPPKDGGSKAVYAFTEGFADLNCRVDIAALNTKKHHVNIQKIKDELPESIQIHAFDMNTDIKPGNLLLNFCFSKLPYNAVRFMNKDFGSKLISLLNKKAYDIVQIEGLYMLPYINIIRSYSDAVIGYRAHNIEHEIWERVYVHEKNVLKKVYLKSLYKRIKRFEQSFLNTYDVLIPITKRDADHFEKLGNRKPVHASPTGIDMKNLSNSSEEYDPKKLFHLGSMDWYPNQEGLLWFLEHVWKKISNVHPKLKFTLAGRNAPLEFTKKIKSYKNVIFKGEVDSAEAFINEHSIMIIPLLSGSGMRIKIIEGMAYGKAVITTSVGAEGIPVKDMNEVLIADTADQFIEKINFILKKPDVLKKISSQAKRFISDNFDNFAISKSLLDFYGEQMNT